MVTQLLFSRPLLRLTLLALCAELFLQACAFAPQAAPAASSPSPTTAAPASAAEQAPLALPDCSFAQGRAPQVASYCMSVQLDPETKTVAGVEQITYRNPSQDTLNEVWLRLYLRAFRDRDSLWMRETGGQNRIAGFDPEAPGDITVSKLALAGGADLLANATLTETLMHVPLPQPLAPGQRLDLDVSWTSQLPQVFARTGYGGRDDTFFMLGQWYPKLAVYDGGRWDTEPWHGNAEFFADFGGYDVTIAAPKEYINVGAAVYGKTALGLWMLEGVVGTERLRAAMADYLALYRFKHPTGADFRDVLERALGDQSWFFDDYLNGDGVVDYKAEAIETTASGSTVGVSRQGTVPAPVDIRITLADGTQQLKTWDGQANTVTFGFAPEQAVTKVEVDPERKLKPEMYLVNNSISADAQS